MDLELTDEQTWLRESTATLLQRTWVPAEAVAEADGARRQKVWDALVEFGALSVGRGELGLVELCIIARELGAHLASAPFAGSAALRLAIEPFSAQLPPGFAALLENQDAVGLALLEPGGRWTGDEPTTALEPGGLLHGEKVGVEGTVEQLLVVAAAAGQPALALVAADDAVFEDQTCIDTTLPMRTARFDATAAHTHLTGDVAHEILERLTTIGALLAAAEAVGAADEALAYAARYAGERRQFGVPIASFQALRHILADMHVRAASGWSTVLYAAAAFDDQQAGAPQTASVAKAYVSRGAREVVHGAMQVFGGIAFTDEHPTHRFLRRIIVREQQFGDAIHHERVLGRALAASLAPTTAA